MISTNTSQWYYKIVITDNQKLFAAVSELKLIDPGRLQTALEDATAGQLDLSDLLYDRDLLTDPQIGQLLADIHQVPYIDLSQQTVPDDITDILPEIYSIKQQLAVFRKDDRGLHVALVDPGNSQNLDFISKKTGLPVVAYQATSRDIRKFFETQSVKGQTFTRKMTGYLEEAKNHLDDKTPVIHLVNEILEFGYLNRASDVHIEPQEKFSVVRFRVDGILHDIINLPPEVHQQTVTRIKVVAHLKIDEHQSAQDGKFQFDASAERMDIRVSVTPVVQGEKVVMRLLSSRSRQFSLSNLGLSDTDLNKITTAFKKPYGMILSTGPTGSGKTTTLYSILKLLNNRSVNIMTIEDPVEYEVEGINQIQVNPATNLTFSDGLRSIVRQDPNIILVGEIRDDETAKIAASSAMTGHLVLSTLHTNDAATAVPRLYDMNVEPFIIASSVNCIIGQRLVRKICEKCRKSDEVTLSAFTSLGLDKDLIKKIFKSKKTIRVYQGQGCPVCHNTGYSGRIGIFEVMTIDGDVRQAISESASSPELQKLSIAAGMTTMLADGIAKVLAGITTIEEIMRVTKT